MQKELYYDPNTGLLWWIKPKKGRRLNRPAGRRSKGRYVTIGWNLKQYAAQHLAWLLMTGDWPKEEIDHKNRIRTDNRWKNLREATSSQNKGNTKLRDDNSSGYRGVSWHAARQKWRARLSLYPKEIHLGLFSSKRAARAAYVAAAKKHFGEFARAS